MVFACSGESDASLGEEVCGLTFGLWVLTNVLIEVEFVLPRLILWNHASDHGCTALLDLIFGAAEVFVEMAEADLGDDLRSLFGDDVVLDSELFKEPVPALLDLVFSPFDQR